MQADSDSIRHLEEAAERYFIQWLASVEDLAI